MRAFGVALLGLLLFSAGCARKSRLPAPPPPPNYFQLGQDYFESGDYANAIQAYTAWMRDHSAADNSDLVLFRLALSNALPEGSLHNMPQAMQLLKQLVTQYPKSPLKSQAEFLLRLQDEVNRLRADLGKRDDRIKELTRELEKLKQIDMQRRPTRVPP